MSALADDLTVIIEGEAGVLIVPAQIEYEDRLDLAQQRRGGFRRLGTDRLGQGDLVCHGVTAGPETAVLEGGGYVARSPES